MTSTAMRIPAGDRRPSRHCRLFGSRLRSSTRARSAAGLLETRSGSVETPAFMPVGTQATVKGLTPDQLRATGTRMLLANTYHLALRPGEAGCRVARRACTHSWAGTGRSSRIRAGFKCSAWPSRNRITDEGVTLSISSGRPACWS